MILLTDILRLGDPARYKLHLIHPPDDLLNPLEVFAVDASMGDSMEPWRAEYGIWQRQLIFALNQFGQTGDLWLFGGVFRVIECLPYRYAIEDLPAFRKFVGRLVLRFRRRPWMLGYAYRFEEYVGQFEVVEVRRRVEVSRSFQKVQTTDWPC